MYTRDVIRNNYSLNLTVNSQRDYMYEYRTYTYQQSEEIICIRTVRISC